MPLAPSSSFLAPLGFHGFLSNNPLSNASIWCLFKTNSNLNLTISDFSSQQLSISFLDPTIGRLYLLTAIYASNNYVQRRALSDYLTSKAPINLPWCVVGDFNSITSASEKLSLRPSRLNTEFQQMILNFGLQDLGYTGNNFTWSKIVGALAMWQPDWIELSAIITGFLIQVTLNSLICQRPHLIIAPCFFPITSVFLLQMLLSNLKLCGSITQIFLDLWKIIGTQALWATPNMFYPKI